MKSFARCFRPPTLERGFALQELVVVMLIVGIISAIAVARTGNDPILLSTQTEQLAGDIRYVQTLAMTQGQRYTISFPSATSYQFLDSAGNPVVHPVSGSSAAVTLGAGATLALQATTPAGNAIGFDGRGTPYSVTTPATFNGPLTALATVTLTKGGSNDSVTITQETGKVTP
jgi:prepilin-type N-terminal cleavage/methylation domain-containing protein